MNRLLRHVVESLLLVLTAVLFGAGCDCQKKTEPVTVTERVESGFTLTLVQNADPHEMSCTLSKGQSPGQDHVRWVNQTAGPVTITFTTVWPFLEPDNGKTITVPAGASSEFFTLDPSKPNGAYDYQTTPTLVKPDTGHGEPSISVGG